tara:strand:- start:99 stop:533 length:435 start_codon:yes stop_codon:yes gene_type:complete
MTDVSRRLEGSLGTARVTNRASLMENFEDLKNLDLRKFKANPMLRFVIPENFVGVEMDFILILDDEYRFDYAVVVRHSKRNIETHILTYWRQVNLGNPYYFNQMYGLPKEARWCDTDKRSRDDGDYNYIRLALQELGINTAESL